MKVIVVGAGIIGASIAWHLARAGARVTVIDDGAPAASHNSFGWINASFYHDAGHHRLRVAGMGAWTALCAAVPDLPVETCGAVWFEDQWQALVDMKSALQALDYPVDHLTGQAASKLEPDLCARPDEVLLFPSEAAADAAGVARGLLAASGARVVRNVQVTGLRSGDAITGVETSIGALCADRVVIAAGTGAPEILATAGVRLSMLTRPGALVTTVPVAARIHRILVTPHGEVRQLPDGRLLASAVASHQGDDAAEVTDTPDAIAARVLGWLDPLIAGGVPGWSEVSLGWRPVPEDGLPVIGEARPGLHVAVMHSGVTLAAIAGQVTAAEVLGQGGFDDLVTPYRQRRFQ